MSNNKAKQDKLLCVLKTAVNYELNFYLEEEIEAGLLVQYIISLFSGTHSKCLKSLPCLII
jgi:hypothetical protein